MAELTSNTLPALPAAYNDFIRYVSQNPEKPMTELVEPFKEYDAKLREIFAQEPGHEIIKNPHVNIVPVFDGATADLKIRARNLKSESAEEASKYVMPLTEHKRKANGMPAVVPSLKDFQHNFSVFSESSLSDMDWSNVVVAGSAVVTSLLPVPKEYAESRRALREYYHQLVAPASDVDLFIYGLSEDQALEKIKQIETKVRDSILEETTTIRTKNAITIASQYPTRHVQIVLRIYKSISEILTGFDVDSSCAAYDGKQVYASPRALAAYMTQINHIDLSRRSPSYENRLSKYSHRGFEIYWPLLDRTRIDPTIFERSFQRTLGLARLLVLEKLPSSKERDEYTDKRRHERGRPPLYRYHRFSRVQNGNIKATIDDEVAEWVDEEEVSDYHTFTVPYGEKFTAKRIEKLLYAKDLLLNAEWNKPKDREVHLHRHPALFGSATYVVEDCCGYCPKPTNIEEEEIAEEEAKIYVSGRISFIKDNPGRQTIGSFNPLTDDDWTEMAYVGNTARLCQAIVDGDVDHVKDWLAQDGTDPNQRDYTGRTPLHLAVTSSTAEIVNVLVEAKARITARLADGRTALHLAAARGDVDIIKILMDKSESNEAEEEEKIDLRRKNRAKKTAVEDDNGSRQHGSDSIHVGKKDGSASSEASEDLDLVDDEESDEDGVVSIATGSFVKVPRAQDSMIQENIPLDDDEEEPDFYDINVLTWDRPSSPLHVAIANGHTGIVKELCTRYGADVLLPIKLLNEYDRSPRAAILTLVLALALPTQQALAMAQTLLDLGATSLQADLRGITAFHYYTNHSAEAMDVLIKHDPAAVKSALNHVSVSGSWWSPGYTTPLHTAIDRKDIRCIRELMQLGAKINPDFAAFIRVAKTKFENQVQDQDQGNEDKFRKANEQPLTLAIQRDQPDMAISLIEHGADLNTLSVRGWVVLKEPYQRNHTKGETVVDMVNRRIKALQLWDPAADQPKRPLEMKQDHEYLRNFQGNSYCYWSTKSQIEAARKICATELEKFEKDLKEDKYHIGAAKKRAAVDEVKLGYERLWQMLTSKGAKTFKELHPDIQNDVPDQQQTWNYGLQSEKKPFEPEFWFNVAEFNENLRKPYIELFEAAWSGDLTKIKALTTVPQGSNKDEPPLRITASDRQRNNPFSLAVLQGHLEVADAILQIAQTQYVPKDKQKHRYHLAQEDKSDYGDSEDEDSSSNESNLGIQSTKANDVFTVDNIGDLSLQVASEISPLMLLQSACPTDSAMDNSSNILSKAIEKDDLALLEFLLAQGAKYVSLQSELDKSDDARQYMALDHTNLTLAIRLGRTRLLAKLLARTGAGIPLDELVTKSDADKTEQPTFYQGLSVHGQKRADWATAGRQSRAESVGASHSPLLIAAFQGSIDSVEWFMSDAPVRCYLEFAEMYKHDKRVQQLSQSTGGFEKAVRKWLCTRDQLLLHCAIMAKPTEDSLRLVKLLLETMPELLEKKNVSGWTPLYTAFSFRRYDAAKALIAAGANQNTKDSVFNNLLHALLTPNPQNDNQGKIGLEAMLDLLEPDIRAGLFVQRNGYRSGSNTPLHRWLEMSRIFHRDWGYVVAKEMSKEESLEILEIWLKHSKGAELDLINGAGQTPLHTLVGIHEPQLEPVRMLLNCKSSLLYRENAVGRTPYECAWDASNADSLTRVPSFGNETYYSYWTYANSSDNTESQQLENFMDKAEEGEDQDRQIQGHAQKLRQLWRFIQKFAEENPGKRRLVTLNEANEVARRLAETQNAERDETVGPTGAKLKITRQLEGGDEEKKAKEEEEKNDEVNTWSVEASQWGFEESSDASGRRASPSYSLLGVRRVQHLL